jgi:hypothetical protein
MLRASGHPTMGGPTTWELDVVKKRTVKAVCYATKS